MSSYNLLWRDKKHFLRTWVKIHVIWRHLVTSWSNLKNHDRTFNNNQPINHVSILGRNLLFRVITFIPWYVLNYAKYKFLDKHLNISYPFIKFNKKGNSLKYLTFGFFLKRNCIVCWVGKPFTDTNPFRNLVPVVFYDPTKPALTVEPRNSYLLKCHGYIWDILYLIVSSLMENRRSILTPPHCECFVCGVQPLNSRPHHFVSVLDRIDADLQQTALNYSMNRFLLSFYAC